MPAHRNAGLKPRLTAAEINKWNQAAEPNRRLIEHTTLPAFLQDDRQAWWVWIQNDSGTDRERSEILSLGEPLFDLEDDGTVDLMFSGDDSDPDKDPAVLLEPIADGAVGRAVIHGLAIAKVTSGTHKTAVVNTSGKLDPDSDGPIKLLATPDVSSETLLPVLLGAGSGGTGITDLRLDGNNLQYEKDGVWTTWHTATTCP